MIKSISVNPFIRPLLQAGSAAMIGLLSACTPAALTDQDRSAIEQMTQAWLAAHSARDWNTVADMYTEDAVLMPPFAQIIEGREPIRQWFAENEQFTSISVTILEIEGYEDFAYVRGTSTVTVNRPGVEPLSFTGKYLDIRHRDADGAWRVAVDMFSPDAPLE